MKFLWMALCLGWLGLTGHTALAQPRPASLELRGKSVDWPSFADEACDSAFLFVGEQHNNPLHHEIQHLMLKEMLERQPERVRLAMEMVQIPFQPVLNAFVQGEIPMRALPECLNWPKTWGFDFAMYSPMLELCQKYGVPVRAMRFSSDSSKRLGQEGLAALSESERLGLSGADPNDFGPGLERLRQVFMSHASSTSEEAFQRFVRVQVLWEEGMASQIVASYRPGSRVVVLVGAGHLTLGHGLPLRVMRRFKQRPSRGARVLLIDPAEADLSRAHLVWWSETRGE